MNENTILKSVPAAGALRKVPGFDPLKHLRTTTSHKTGEKVLKLDLPFKKLWFRLACPNGRMLLKPLRITDQMAIFEAKVFLSKDDPTPISNFTSTQMAKDVPGGLYIRAAQDEALNEALDNAGFGIQLCDVIQVSDGSHYGSEIPLAQVEAARKAGQNIQVATTDVPVTQAAETKSLDQSVGSNDLSVPPSSVESAGMEEPAAIEAASPVPELAAQNELEMPESVAEAIILEPVTEKQNYAVMSDLPAQEIGEPDGTAASETEFMTAEVVEDAAAPETYTADMSVEEICERMSLDDAKGVVVDIGTCKGWTLEQVAERRTPSLKFYVRGCSDASNVLKAAATLLLTDLEQKKAG